MSTVVEEPATSEKSYEDRLEEARAEAGLPPAGQQTIDGGEVTAPPVPLEELRIDGTTQLGMIDFGGKRPTSASLRLAGGSVDLVDGRAFVKGDVISGTWTAVVFDVGGVDKHDPKTGIVVSAKQRHVARIVDLTVNA